MNYPLQKTLEKYINSNVVLIIATMLALVIANTSYGDAYRNFGEQSIKLSIGKFNLFANGQLYRL